MTTNTQSTVVAIFRSVTDAHAAAEDLKTIGFTANDIFISSDRSAGSTYDQPGTAYRAESHHEGGITGWFKSLFGEDHHADQPYYESAVNSGNTFLSVEVNDNNVERAVEVLNRHSPVDIQNETQNEAQNETGRETTGRTALGATAAATTTGGTRQTNAPEAIPVVQEEFQVGKRAVLRGGVRVYSRMVSQPVSENISLREEKVRVERNPVNREATEADLRPGQERVFEVKEYAEEPVVSKQARVVEEVRVSKEATEHTETVRGETRRTEVNVENLGRERVEDRVPGGTRSTGSVGTGSATGTGAATGTAYGANEADFRRHFTSTYGGSQNYDTFGPAYNYGYDMAGDPRYKGRDFDEVEPQLREDYGRRYPNSTWEQMKDSVRYGWNKLTGKV